MIAIDVASALIIGRYCTDCLYLRIRLKPVQLDMICFVLCCIFAKTQRRFLLLIACPPFISIAFMLNRLGSIGLTTSFVYITFVHWNFYAKFFWSFNFNIITFGKRPTNPLWIPIPFTLSQVPEPLKVCSKWSITSTFCDLVSDGKQKRDSAFAIVLWQIQC